VNGEYESACRTGAASARWACDPDAEAASILIATQWLHVDRISSLICSGCPGEGPPDHGGIGGAFGAREDCRWQAHACMLALAPGGP